MINKDYRGARILLKRIGEDPIVADTTIKSYDVDNEWIWVDSDGFFVPENTQLEGIIITPNKFHEILCMVRRKESSTGLQLAIYKHLSDDEKRHEDRYNLATKGYIILATAGPLYKDKKIAVTITDISANGIGFIVDSDVKITKSMTIDIYFNIQGGEMKGKCQAINIFGPKVGAKLLSMEKVHADINAIDMDVEGELRLKIDKALESTYLSIHYMDIYSDTFVEVLSTPQIRNLMGKAKVTSKILQRILDAAISDSDRPKMEAFYDWATLESRLKNRKSLSCVVSGGYIGTVLVSLIPVEKDAHGCTQGLLHTIQRIEG